MLFPKSIVHLNYIESSKLIELFIRLCYKSVTKIRQDTIKLLEENIGKTLSDINIMNIFSGQSPKATEMDGRSFSKR